MAFAARLARASLRSMTGRRAFSAVPANLQQAFEQKSGKSDDDYSPHELKYNFFNLPMSESAQDVIASKRGIFTVDMLKTALVEHIEEKIDKYEPVLNPDSNAKKMSIAEVKALNSDAKLHAKLDALAAKGVTEVTVETGNASGMPLAHLFVEELALYISRASISCGQADPLAFMKSLYTKDFPSNYGETLAMDMLVGLHGASARQTSVPFSQQINPELMAQVESLLAPRFAQANWAAKVSNYMYEVAAQSSLTQKQLHTPDYYNMFYAFFPCLVLFIVFTYWEEFHHIAHQRHEQHERVEELLKKEL